MRHLRRMLTGIMLCSLAIGIAYSQAINATLVGTVTDSSGAAVPNAKVTITEVNTGIGRTADTNTSGNYTFANLPPGVYTVAVEQAGFRRAARTGVDVAVNTTVRIDLTLQPGEISETINVSAEATILQTDRADTGRQIDTKTIADMPLGVNRSFQNLLNLVPGTTKAFRPHSLFFNSMDSLSTQVNGQTRLANDLMIEGVENQQRTGLLAAYIPPVEALLTVNVTTSNYDAELGHAGGAATSVILKSGTNQFHGSVYEFNNVSALAARSFFAAKKPVTTYNYFGGTIGGPVIKNKTFFFFDYLRTTDRRGQINRFVIPTPDFRAGDFSAAITNPKAISSGYSGPVAVYDPLTGNPDGSGRTPFSGNQIPDSRISPISKKLLALIPAPNLGGYGTNFSQNSTFSRDVNSMDIKIDHNATERDRIAVRYSEQRPTLTDPAIFGTIAGGPHDNGGGGFEGTGKTVIQTGAVNYDHIFSPTLITQVRAGIIHFRNEAHQSDYGSNTSTQLGIKGVNLDPWTSGITYLQIDQGYSNPLVGYSGSLPWIRGETNFDVVNTWTKTFGNHTIKWGVDVRRDRDELLQTQTFNPRGVFRYNDTVTSCNSRGVRRLLRRFSQRSGRVFCQLPFGYAVPDRQRHRGKFPHLPPDAVVPVCAGHLAANTQVDAQLWIALGTLQAGHAAVSGRLLQLQPGEQYAGAGRYRECAHGSGVAP